MMTFAGTARKTQPPMITNDNANPADTETLYDLRQQSGMTCRQILEAMMAHAKRPLTCVTTVIKWEYEGTDSVENLKVYALALGVDFERILLANENSRRLGRPKPGKGRGRKQGKRGILAA